MFGDLILSFIDLIQSFGDLILLFVVLNDTLHVCSL